MNSFTSTITYNGVPISYKILPATTSPKLLLQYGQYTTYNSPVRFAFVLHPTMAINTDYTLTIPMIKNPSTQQYLDINVYSIKYIASQLQPTIVSSYNFQKIVQTSSTAISTMSVTQNNI